VRCIHADADCVAVGHSGRTGMPDDRQYDNNYCSVLCGLLNGGRSRGTRNLKDDLSHL
jgi:ketosteroid isomerase-like protein